MKVDKIYEKKVLVFPLLPSAPFVCVNLTLHTCVNLLSHVTALPYPFTRLHTCVNTALLSPVCVNLLFTHHYHPLTRAVLPYTRHCSSPLPFHTHPSKISRVCDHCSTVPCVCEPTPHASLLPFTRDFSHVTALPLYPFTCVEPLVCVKHHVCKDQRRYQEDLGCLV
jgi:hypothetical protein